MAAMDTYIYVSVAARNPFSLDRPCPKLMMMEEVAGEISFRRASEFLSSLISSTYSTTSFAHKWKSIRNKLEELSSGLEAAAERAADSGENSSALAATTELLHTIASTANETQQLVRKLSDGSYTGGKLLLRSDLDVAASKFGLHISRLNEIYASGFLTPPRAIVVSRPAAGASREDMRFFVIDLLCRIKIGVSGMRAEALTILNEILNDDERYVKTLAVETVEGIDVLVNLLEPGDVGIQEKAAEAVSLVAGFESYRGILVAAGVVAPLIRILEFGSKPARVMAARALNRLTENANNSWLVSAHGGVTTLLKICSSDDSRPELVCHACGVLTNLSGVAEIKRFMVEEGIVSVLKKLTRSNEEVCQIQGIELLLHLASEDDAIKSKMVREGVIKSLVDVLEPNSMYSSKAREIALMAIQGICFSSSHAVNLLMVSSFIDRALFFLRNGDVSVQELALKTASRLCGLSEEAKKVMGDAGFMPELMKFLEAKSLEVREMAAATLCSMVSVQKNRKRFIQEDHNVSKILQLLNPDEEKSAPKKLLLSMLMTLSGSKTGRKKMAASGYVKNLEKLAEKDVMDAKKIIKKLSGSRFWSMLASRVRG